MPEFSVDIVELPPCRVASALGFGSSPEPVAWEKIFAFIKEKGLWDQMSSLDYYGFNYPEPSPGSPNYGYEQWVTVTEGIEGNAEVTVKSFSGGLYAVTRCWGIPTIYDTWQKLIAWREDSRYIYGGHQWLEKWVNKTPNPLEEADMIMDLYMPVIQMS